MRFESMYLVWVFVGSSLFQPLYIIYLFVTTIISGPVQWTLLNTSMYIAGTVCLLTHFSLLAVFATVAFNFGKGLCEKGNYGRLVSSPLFSLEMLLSVTNVDSFQFQSIRQNLHRLFLNQSQPVQSLLMSWTRLQTLKDHL